MLGLTFGGIYGRIVAAGKARICIQRERAAEGGEGALSPLFSPKANA